MCRVLLSPTAKGIYFAAVAGRTLVDGMEKGIGVGAYIISHPLEAAAWLANKFYPQGGGLVSGQIILTGNAAPVTRLANDRGTATIEAESLGAT